MCKASNNAIYLIIDLGKISISHPFFSLEMKKGDVFSGAAR
jgi:hypothetical protein